MASFSALALKMSEISITKLSNMQTLRDCLLVFRYA